MGGNRKRGRTQRRDFKQSRENVWQHDPKKTCSDDPSAGVDTTAAAEDSNPPWQHFVTQNPNFDEYYKALGIVSENEWEEFICCLQRPLPAAFRINASGQFFQDIKLQLESDFVKSLKAEGSDEHEIEAIRPLPWYPGNLAWHMNFSRMQLRKNQTLERFHAFLKQENEVGNITRQEAVSMVPPLFLDVLPNHCILDMCAAPGSKTFQLLEIMHHSIKPGSLPNGLVIANDVDVQRCNLLIHQTKRMCTANLIVTNHEAQHFPRWSFVKGQTESFKGQEELRKSNMQFDRVLCDVPCSGDGTLRKAPDIWRKWNAGMGNGLHRLQVEIAMRGIALLKTGGRMVYSTCSMNPVENEAVVAEVLQRTGGSVRLLDVSNELPELVRRPGLKTWKIKDRGLWLVSYKDVPIHRRNIILPSMFPSGQNYEESCLDNGFQDFIGVPGSSIPEGKFANLRMSHPDSTSSEHHNGCGKFEKESMLTDNSKPKEDSAYGEEVGCHPEEEISGFPLEHCMRIVPHDQNGGAFFIAVFQKVSSLYTVPDSLARKSNHQVSAVVDEKLEDQSEADVASSKDVSDKNHLFAAGVPSDSELMTESPMVKSNISDVCVKDKDWESEEACENESAHTGMKEVKRKFQIQGKWRGVDPVVFFNDETTVNSIRSFYGISESFPLDGHLVTRNSDTNHVKRIYYISKSLHDVLQLNFQVGQRLKITSLGLKIFERQSSKDGSSLCSFRLSSEGLPLILPYISKQILYASLADLKHLLQYRTIKFADFVAANFGEKVSSLMPGCCVVVLNEGNQAEGNIMMDLSMIAIVCWRGKTNLSIMVSQLDAQELLERVSVRYGIQTISFSKENEDDKLDIVTTKKPSTQPMDASESADQ